MRKHKFNNLPEMGRDDYRRLWENINNNGYDPKYPITLYQGDILDGWNRYKVITDLNLTPTYIEFEGDDLAALSFVIKSNTRRNLTSSQWACVAVEQEDMIKLIKEKVIKEGYEKRETGNRFVDRGEQIPHDVEIDEFLGIETEKKEQVRTSKILADLYNTNDKYIKEISKIKNESPELFEQVKSGERTITDIKKEERQKDIERQIEDIKKIDKLNGQYDLIVFDPPWAYGTEYNPDNGLGRVAAPYPEMDFSELAKIELPSTDNCILWFWTTHQFIWEAKRLMEIYGFDYRSILVWDKEKMGIGGKLRYQCEFCLLGIKGKPIWTPHNLRDIIREPRREHSRKPDIFYQMLEDNFHGNFLDYFSRNQFSDKWSVYGNETDKFKQ